jgi:UDP-N-acetylglucosamine--N-acetylmuramyl-(pentapeptide) pyrophosphoryl-undecaprenol N-acetylglucosamine transferase
VFPAFAVDEKLAAKLHQRGDRYERFWIGSGLRSERNWVEGAGIAYLEIKSGKLRRYLSWRLFPDLVGVVVGFFQSLAILRRERPDILFSKGGYVSVPPVLAARILGIPAVTHESDAFPGLATRIHAHFVQAVCIPFPEAITTFPRKLRPKTVSTGVPSRLCRTRANADRGRQAFGIPPGAPVIVVLGGSQGALQINNLVWETLDELVELGVVVHQTGDKTYRPITREGYHAVPFIADGLEDILAAATVVVSRSGATALADYLEMELPMVLIPLGSNASRGDQMENARRLGAVGAAEVLEGPQICGEQLVSVVRNLISHDIVRSSMVEKMIPMRAEDPAGKIAGVILQTAEGTKKRRC